MKLALGTVQFGVAYGIANAVGQVSRRDAYTILQMARHHGVDTLDTAIAYGDSEACLGDLGTSDFKVISKLPAMPEDCDDVTAWVRSQFAASLARLKRNSIYGLLLHRAEQLIGPRGRVLAATLLALKDEGLVGKIGVSIYSPVELAALTTACQIDLVQAPFNLLDRRLLTSGWMDRLYQSGVEIHTRSAFLQGLLLMGKDAIPPGFQRWSSLLDRWHRWLVDRDTSAVSTCLSFSHYFPQISRVVVGVDTADHFAQLLSAESLVLKQNIAKTGFPDLTCDDEFLINPSNWKYLGNEQ